MDAHVHLSDTEYKPNIDKVIEAAEKANVVALVSNSMNLETSLQNIKLTQKYVDLVYAALGIHPWNVKELLPNELEQTTELILQYQNQKEVVAIGEIGLDRKYLKRGQEELWGKQYEVFCRMLQLSEKLSLPAIIHSRGTTQEIMDVLPTYRIKKVLFHWFSSPLTLLPVIVDRGYYITEGPPAVFSSDTQEIIRQVPLTHLLTETDGPVQFFKPPFKGALTTPAFIPQVVEAIAKIKGLDKVDVAEQILQNFTTSFDVKLVQPNSFYGSLN